MNNNIIDIFRPSRLFLIIGLTISCAFALISNDMYFYIFKSIKITSPYAFFSMILYIILLSLFSRIGEKLHLDFIAAERINIQPWWLRSGLLLCLAAYCIWFGLAIFRAGGVYQLYYLYKENAFFIKEVVMKPIAGITSFTQLAVICIPFNFLSMKRDKINNSLIYVILILDFIRSIIFSERLALLEIFIPLIVLIMIQGNYRKSIVIRNLLFIVIFVILFFIVSEAGRSFASRGIFDWSTIFQLGFFRFFGYYLTSVDNFMLAFDKLNYDFPFYFTFLPLWSLPGLEGVYNSLSNTASFYAPEVLTINNLNPELNVFTMPGYWNMEFGNLGTLIAASIFGLISGVVFNNARRSGYWLAFYSVWLIGILEFMRIYYIGSPRITVPLAYFFATMLFFRRKKSKYTI